MRGSGTRPVRSFHRRDGKVETRLLRSKEPLLGFEGESAMDADAAPASTLQSVGFISPKAQ